MRIRCLILYFCMIWAVISGHLVLRGDFGDQSWAQIFFIGQIGPNIIWVTLFAWNENEKFFFVLGILLGMSLSILTKYNISNHFWHRLRIRCQILVLSIIWEFLVHRGILWGPSWAQIESRDCILGKLNQM